MIKFSERQLKTPRFMRPVYLVTAASPSTPGRSRRRERGVVHRRFDDGGELLGLTPAELKKYIHTCYYGHFADHFGDQLLGEAVIHDRLGLDPLGNVGIKSGGATGARRSGKPPRRWPRDTPTAFSPWAGSAWTRSPPMRQLPDRLCGR